MTNQKLIDYCLTFPSVYEDYPFDGEKTSHSDDGVWAVMRHMRNKKSFAHIYKRNGKLCINLKCDPFKADLLRSVYLDLVPGWHMNKTHWNTVYVGGDVPIEELYGLIRHSYDLIKPKARKGVSQS
jgi:predicted DNA-binding protein (MmcQ/YjbR family)